MRCHSVCSFFSPSREVQFSVVAMLKLATDCPPGVTRTSASLPRFPTRITLYTLPMSRHLFSSNSAALPSRLCVRVYWYLGVLKEFDRSHLDREITRPLDHHVSVTGEVSSPPSLAACRG